MSNTKKEMSAEQSKDILNMLKTRFEKNMQRHKGLEWAKYKRDLKQTQKNYRRSMKWKELAVNQMWLVLMKRPANTFL